jgi:hypothetical protein
MCFQRFVYWRLGPQLVVLLEVMETLRGGALLENIGHWSVPSKGILVPHPLPLALSLPPGHGLHEVSISLCYTFSRWRSVSPQPQSQEPSSHGLKLLKPWAKINPFFFISSYKLNISVILSQPKLIITKGITEFYNFMILTFKIHLSIYKYKKSCYLVKL